MKRSEINTIERDALALMDRLGWKLPPWALWTPEEWRANKAQCRFIRDFSLGWDITDFGSGRFAQRGLFLFTLRNGRPGEGEALGRSYAEKIMMVGENQETPYHFHWHKREDIINRGGGVLLFNIYGSDEREEFSREDLTVRIDDIPTRINPGEEIALKPGQSLCLDPGVYHRFYGAPGEGPVLTGEVSQVNDDARDNRFYEEIGRFPEIEEDEALLYPLMGDLPRLLGEENR